MEQEQEVDVKYVEGERNVIEPDDVSEQGDVSESERNR